MQVNGHRPSIADRIVSARAWADQPVPPALVPDWLPARGLAFLYGAPKTGKSLVALDLAAQATTGGTWCDAKPADVDRVLYVAAEAPWVLAPRIELWLAEHGLDDLPVDVLPDVVHFGSDHDASDLAAHVAANPYPLVIVDTWARCTVGLDENSARDMGPAAERLLTVNPNGLTVAVHHPTKSADRVLRGHGTLLAAIDSSIHAGRSGSTLTLTSVAQRAMREGATATYTIAGEGDGAVVRPIVHVDIALDALRHGDTRQQWAARLAELHEISLRTAQARITEAIDAGLAINTGTRQRASYERTA